ncbi:hypothetical protein PHYBOEH_002465 [Phytophthora boehmeriae]|uniref:Mitochondrial cardiolipin hydrolase n=1 Tax=Phytophthora boehmeriae TaxID=109152 RepID=A0A8T1WXQ0_9STRA|nr:hypothetical protein PHYBOEH_002465 [Phytophthora boehmeriae]
MTTCSCPTRVSSLPCVECSLFTLVQILCPGFNSADAATRSRARDAAIGIVSRLEERVTGADQATEDASAVPAAATATDSIPEPAPEPSTAEANGNKRPLESSNDRCVKRKTDDAGAGKSERQSRGRPKQWPLWKAVDAISQQLELVSTESSLSKAAKAAGIKKSTFYRLKEDVKCRLSNTIVGYWFDEGKDRLLTRIADTKSTIDVAMPILNDPSVTTALKTAAGGGVKIRIMTDFVRARAESKDQLLELLQCGNIQVFHCTNLMQWKCAIFDARLLHLESADWSLSDVLGRKMEYTVVFSGPVVQAFVGQFEGMFEEAGKMLGAHGGPKIFYHTTAQSLE